MTLFNEDVGGAAGDSTQGASGKSVDRPCPLRILVAEDNIVNQKVIVGLLSKLGYHPDVVRDGNEAVSAVKQKTYELVLMDGQMPELDGESATQLIRNEIAPERQPWIVAMTANVLEGDRARYLAAGMNDFIAKPICPENLLHVLRRVPPNGVVNIE